MHAGRTALGVSLLVTFALLIVQVATDSNVEAPLVAAALTSVAGTCLVLASRFKDALLHKRTRIAYWCLGFALSTFSTTAAIAATQSNPSGALFTSKSWFSTGWTKGLSIFSIRIDCYWKYIVVCSYQIVRAFLGSALTNYFRSFLYTMQAHGASGSIQQDYTFLELAAAQFSYNIFAFYVSLTDSYLLLSQLDLFALTAIATIVADLQTTWFMMPKRQIVALEVSLVGGKLKL